MFIYMFIYNIKMTKIISVTDEAYERLRKLKQGESFSKTIMRLTSKEKHKSLLDFAGAWKGDKKEMDKIFKGIAESRKHAKMKDVQL